VRVCSERNRGLRQPFANSHFSLNFKPERRNPVCTFAAVRHQLSVFPLASRTSEARFSRRFFSKQSKMLACLIARRKRTTSQVDADARPLRRFRRDRHYHTPSALCSSRSVVSALVRAASTASRSAPLRTWGGGSIREVTAKIVHAETSPRKLRSRRLALRHNARRRGFAPPPQRRLFSYREGMAYRHRASIRGAASRVLAQISYSRNRIRKAYSLPCPRDRNKKTYQGPALLGLRILRIESRAVVEGPSCSARKSDQANRNIDERTGLLRSVAERAMKKPDFPPRGSRTAPIPQVTPGKPPPSTASSSVTPLG